MVGCDKSLLNALQFLILGFQITQRGTTQMEIYMFYISCKLFFAG